MMSNSLANVALNVPPMAGLSLLEHLCAKVSDKCEYGGKKPPLLLAIDYPNKKAVYIQARCKMWSCASCGHRNAAQWTARVIQGINHYSGQWYFMTLTAHRYWRGEIRSLINLRQGWTKLYHRFLRMVGKFHYIKIYEHHKDGSLHLHLLTDLKLAYKYSMKQSKKTGQLIKVYRSKVLKDMAAQCGIGYKADYQPLENTGLAAWYLTKYLHKSIGKSDFPRSLRRIQASTGWPKLPEKGGDSLLSWSYIKNRDHMLRQAFYLMTNSRILTYDATLGRDLYLEDFEPIM